MAADPNYGWIRIDSDAMRLAFEDSDLDVDFLDVDDNLTPLPGDSIIGFDFGTMKRTLKLFNVRAKTLADISRIIDKLKDLLIQEAVNTGNRDKIAHMRNSISIYNSNPAGHTDKLPSLS